MQATREHRSGRDAIEVEIAEYHDAFVVAHRALQTIDRRAKLRNRVGIEPIALDVGRKERTRLFERIHAMGNHGSRRKMRQAKFLLNRRYKRRVCRHELELGCHNVHAAFA